MISFIFQMCLLSNLSSYISIHCKSLKIDTDHLLIYGKIIHSGLCIMIMQLLAKIKIKDLCCSLVHSLEVVHYKFTSEFWVRLLVQSNSAPLPLPIIESSEQGALFCSS